MRAKICGLTNKEDAFSAIDYGADALGFILYEKSKRYITPEKLKNITDSLPPFVDRVGVFVNKSPEEIAEIMSYADLSLAQIHFEMSELDFKKLESRYLKVVRAKESIDIKQHENSYRLVDAFCENYGGEGVRLNLELFKGVDCSKIILAGGLNEQNLDELRGSSFYGVDVSSGVEKRVGEKDRIKMKKFIKKAKEL